MIYMLNLFFAFCLMSAFVPTECLQVFGVQQNQDSSILSDPKDRKVKETGETCKEVENQQRICLYIRVCFCTSQCERMTSVSLRH